MCVTTVAAAEDDNDDGDNDCDDVCVFADVLVIAVIHEFVVAS